MVEVFTGKNAYALKAAVDKKVAEARAEIGDIGIERIDAGEAEVDSVLQAVQSLPFLVPSKLVVITNTQSNQPLLDRAEELIDRTADGVHVLLIGPVFDKRKSSWNILKKRAKVYEFNELKPFELPKWVVAMAKDSGVKITMSDASYLVDRVGTNQLVLTNEIEKMRLNTDTITKDVIDELTEPHPQSTIFDMLDAAFSGDQKRTIELYRQQRKQRVEPQYVIAMLTWQLNALALAVYADPATEQTLVAAGQSSYSARKSLGLAQKIDRQHIKRYINNLAKLDANIKTSAEPDAALELYLIELTT